MVKFLVVLLLVIDAGLHAVETNLQNKSAIEPLSFNAEFRRIDAENAKLIKLDAEWPKDAESQKAASERRHEELAIRKGTQRVLFQLSSPHQSVPTKARGAAIFGVCLLLILEHYWIAIIVGALIAGVYGAIQYCDKPVLATPSSAVVVAVSMAPSSPPAPSKVHKLIYSGLIVILCALVVVSVSLLVVTQLMAIWK